MSRSTFVSTYQRVKFVLKEMLTGPFAVASFDFNNSKNELVSVECEQQLPGGSIGKYTYSFSMRNKEYKIVPLVNSLQKKKIILTKNQLFEEIQKEMTKMGFKDYSGDSVNEVQPLSLEEPVQSNRIDSIKTTEKVKQALELFIDPSDEVFDRLRRNIDTTLSQLTDQEKTQLKEGIEKIKNKKDNDKFNKRYEIILRSINYREENIKKVTEYNELLSEKFPILYKGKDQKIQKWLEEYEKSLRGKEEMDNSSLSDSIRFLKATAYTFEKHPLIIERISQKTEYDANAPLTYNERDLYLQTLLADLPYLEKVKIQDTVKTLYNSIRYKEHKQKRYKYKISTDSRGSISGNNRVIVETKEEAREIARKMKGADYGQIIFIEKCEVGSNGSLDSWGELLEVIATKEELWTGLTDRSWGERLWAVVSAVETGREEKIEELKKMNLTQTSCFWIELSININIPMFINLLQTATEKECISYVMSCIKGVLDKKRNSKEETLVPINII